MIIMVVYMQSECESNNQKPHSPADETHGHSKTQTADCSLTAVSHTHTQLAEHHGP